MADEPTRHRRSGGPTPAGGPAPAWYTIRVAGTLPRPWPAGLDGFRATVSSAAGAPWPTTELVGRVADQAALLRGLRGLHDRRVLVLEVTRRSGPPPPPASRPSPGATAEER